MLRCVTVAWTVYSLLCRPRLPFLRDAAVDVLLSVDSIHSNFTAKYLNGWCNNWKTTLTPLDQAFVRYDEVVAAVELLSSCYADRSGALMCVSFGVVASC